MWAYGLLAVPRQAEYVNMCIVTDTVVHQTIKVDVAVTNTLLRKILIIATASYPTDSSLYC